MNKPSHPSFVRIYSEATPNPPLDCDSSGMLEIAIRNGNASKELGVGEGDVVELRKG